MMHNRDQVEKKGVGALQMNIILFQGFPKKGTVPELFNKYIHAWVVGVGRRCRAGNKRGGVKWLARRGEKRRGQSWSFLPAKPLWEDQGLSGRWHSPPHQHSHKLCFVFSPSSSSSILNHLPCLHHRHTSHPSISSICTRHHALPLSTRRLPSGMLI